MTRWLIILQEFDTTIKDRPRKENLVGDFLSRMPKTDDLAAVEDQFPDEHFICCNSENTMVHGCRKLLGSRQVTQAPDA